MMKNKTIERMKLILLFVMITLLAGFLATIPQNHRKKVYAAETSVQLSQISLNYSNSSGAVINLRDGLNRNVFQTSNVFNCSPSASEWNNTQGNPQWGWASGLSEASFIYGPKTFSASTAVFGNGSTYKLPFLVLDNNGRYANSGALTVSPYGQILSGSMFSQYSGAAVNYTLYVAIGSTTDNFRTDAQGRYYFAYTAYGTYYLTSNGFTSNPNDSSIVSNKTKIAPPNAINRTYTGSAQIGVMSGTDYALSGTYSATNAGTYTAYVTPQNGYCWTDETTGQKTLQWSIAPANLSGASVVVAEQTYTGSALSPVPSAVTLGGRTLIRNTDYTVSLYANNVKAGTASLTIAGKGNYTGTRTVNFTIKKASQTALNFTNSASVSYGNSLALTLTGVKESGAVSYAILSGGTGAGTLSGGTFIPTKAGKVTIRATVAATANYAATTKDITITVAPKSLAGASITLPHTPYVYTGSPISPSPTVKDGSVTLSSADYTFGYSANVAAGKVTLTVTGKGNYTGTATTTFTIAPRNLSDVTAESIANVVYNAKPYTPNPKLVYGGKTLALGTDYTLSYRNNTDAGTATVLVTGIGNFTGSKSLTFQIDKANQNFSVTGASIPVLTGKGAIIVSGSGIYYLANGYTFTSSDTRIVTVDANGNLKAGDKVGTATITIANPGNDNLKAMTKTVSVTVTLANGFYIGSLTGDNTVYPTLQDAVKAVASIGTIRVKGNPQIAETVSVPAGKTITMTGDASAALSRKDGFTGSLFNVAGGTLAIDTLTLDGKNVEGDSLIVVESGSLAVRNGATIKNGNAVNGGGVYVEKDGNLTLEGGTFIGNVAQYGGAIYIENGTGSVEIEGGNISNNHAEKLGNAIYTNARDISLNGGDATAGMTDCIGIDGDAEITVTGGLTHTVNVEFSEPADKTDAKFVRSEVNGLTSKKLKEYFRVSNPGYTFQPAEAGAGEQGALTLIKSAAVVAVVKTPDGKIEQRFIDLQEAIDYAEINGGTVLLARYTNEADPELNTTEIALTKTLVVSKNVAFGNVEVVAFKKADGNMDFRYEENTSPVTLKRAESLTGEMIRVEKTGSLTLGNVTLDGGANFGGDYGVPVVTDDGKGGAGTAQTNNQGVTAHAPVIVNRGALNIRGDTVIQNNDNNYAKPGLGFGSQNYGGGIRNEGKGKLEMTGGVIRNCYSREGGAIININKPENSDGSVNPDYVPGGNPSVEIKGGRIENNASQMKGAAIQTIYGGANTTVSDGATILNNVSLHDLGTLSVEEGGAIVLSGGTVSAGQGNANAVYVYNKYGVADYQNASTKPYIEGEAAGKLAITGNAAVAGNVHLDAPCFVVDPASLEATETHFMPVIDLTGYAASEKIVLDLSTSGNAVREYGAIAVSDSNNFDKLTISYPKADTALGGRYGVTVKTDKGYRLGYGGFDVTVSQTEPGKLTVSGKCDSGAKSVAVTIGGKNFVFTPDKNGEFSDTIDFIGNELRDAAYGAKFVVGYDGADPIEKTFADGFYVVQFNGETGRIEAPAGTKYVAEDGTKKELSSGTLPNDIKIDADGKAVFVVDGDSRTVFLGERENRLEEDDPALGGEKTDLTDTKAEVNGSTDLEYNLLDKDGNLVFDEWKSASTDGKVTFEGLDGNEDYTVVARKPASAPKIPGKFIAIPQGKLHTLDETETQRKSAFETAYETVANRLYDISAMEADRATADEIDDVLKAYESLSDDVKKLPFIEAAKEKLDKGLDNAIAYEWKEEEACKAILEKPYADVSAGDDEAVSAAIAAFEALPQGARELLSEEKDDLIAKAKKIAVEKIQTAYEDSSKTEHCDTIKNGKIHSIQAESVTEKSEIDRLTVQAIAMLKVRTEYDAILTSSADAMTEESRADLLVALNQAMTDIGRAPQEGVAELKNAAIHTLRRVEAEGLINRYYEEIVSKAETNGITDATFASVTEVRDDAIEYVKAPDRTLAEIKKKISDTFLALDGAEGKAILTDYLKETDADDIKALVDGADGAKAAIGNVTANGNGEIDKIVADTKLSIEKERAKDAVENAARIFSTPAGDRIAKEYVDTKIGAAADADGAWLLAEQAIAKIELEKVRADIFAEISDTDPQKDGKKAAVDKIVDDAKVAVDAAADKAVIAVEKENASLAAVNALKTFDRNHFYAAHQEILDKEKSALRDTDAAAIERALNDLATLYIPQSQTEMNDFRDDLLEKKKVVLIVYFLEAQRDGAASVDVIIDGYIEKVNAVSLAGDIEGDAAAGEALNRLKIQAAADILLQKQKNKAKAEFDRCYSAVTGETDYENAAVKAAHAAIDEAADISEINAVLGEKVSETARGILLSGDSDKTKAIAENVCTAIENLVSQATAKGEVAELFDAAASLADDIAARRTAEKNAAKDALVQKTESAFDGAALPAEVQKWLEEAQKAIEDGAYGEYALIEEKVLAKCEMVKLYDQLLKAAADKGFTGTERFAAAKEKACAAIDGAEDSDGVQAKRAAGETILKKEDGALEIKNYFEKGESDFVEEAALAGERAIAALGETASGEEIRVIVAETKKAIDAERYRDENEVVRKPFEKIAVGDKADLQAALEAFSALSAGAKEKLNAAAVKDGYSDYESFIRDEMGKAEFEAKKEALIERIKTIVHQHDGERVTDVLNLEVKRIEEDFVYEPCLDDGNRTAYLEQLSASLSDTFTLSQARIKHAQKQQRTENQLALDVAQRDDSGRYSDAQKARLKEILEKAREEISAVSVGSTAEEQKEASEKLQEILSLTKGEIEQVPVTSVTAGDLKPDKSPQTDEGTGDYPDGAADELWGIVSNDVGMDGAIRLVIEKTNKKAMKQIEDAARQGKLQIADGSKLAPDNLNALIDGKEIKGALDIYLQKGDVKITEFEGKYIVKILLTPEMRAAMGLQIVYIDEDGNVQVYETHTEDDGKYLVFETTHFSEFYILGEPEINLWWLIILLSVVFIAECAAIFLIAKNKRRKKSNQDVKTYSFFLPALLAVIIPFPAIPVCAVLGALVVAAGIAVVILLLKAPQGQTEQATRAEEIKPQAQARSPEKRAAAARETVLPQTKQTAQKAPQKSVAEPRQTTKTAIAAKHHLSAAVEKAATVSVVSAATEKKRAASVSLVRKEVKAAEVNALMRDEIAAALVEKSAKRSNRTKKGVVNVDTLGACFADGETVTLEEIKKRVRGFDKKITFVKVLARGTLNRALIVEADAFSLEAVKMIALTGGKIWEKGGDT